MIAVLVNEDGYHFHGELAPWSGVMLLYSVYFGDGGRVSRALSVARLAGRRDGRLVPADRVLRVTISVVLIGRVTGLIVIRGFCRLNRGMFIFIRHTML